MKCRLLFCTLSILAMVAVSGCWNRKELDTLSIVEAIGIDNEKRGSITLTFQILKPGEVKAAAGDQEGTHTSGGGGGRGKVTFIITSKGRTVFEAARNATFEAERKLFFAHNKVIVIGEATAKSGIVPLIEFMNRDHEFREGSRIFIAKGKASDIIKSTHEQEKVPADAIENLARISISTSQIPEINLHDFLKTIDSKSSDPYIPGILEVKQDGNSKQRLRLENTAILRKDKLIGWFDKKETRGLLWILGDVKGGIIVVKSPKEEARDVSLEITRASVKVKPEMMNGRLKINVKIKEEGNLGEQMSETVNLTKPDMFKRLEAEKSAVIKDEIGSALAKAQKWGVDIFKFGEAVHRKYPAEWRKLSANWPEEFRKLEVNVQVDAKLRRFGQRTYPDKAEND